VRKRSLNIAKKGEVANGKKEESDDAHKFLHRSGIVCINGFCRCRFQNGVWTI